MPAKTVDQIALDERAIEDDRILTALESWTNAKAEASAASKVARDEKAKAIAMLDELPLEPGEALRCGRFRITRVQRPARTVSFDTAASETLSIKLIPED